MLFVFYLRSFDAKGYWPDFLPTVFCSSFFLIFFCSLTSLVPDEKIVKKSILSCYYTSRKCVQTFLLFSLWLALSPQFFSFSLHLVWLSNICSCDTHTHSYPQLEFGHATNPIGILNESSLLADEDPNDFLLFLFIETTTTDTRETRKSKSNTNSMTWTEARRKRRRRE